MAFIVVGNLSAHRNFCSLAHFLSNVLGHDALQLVLREVLHVCAHTDELDSLGEYDIISDNLAEFGEVPRVPLLETHSIVIELFVEILQE